MDHLSPDRPIFDRRIADSQRPQALRTSSLPTVINRLPHGCSYSSLWFCPHSVHRSASFRGWDTVVRFNYNSQHSRNCSRNHRNSIPNLQYSVSEGKDIVVAGRYCWTRRSHRVRLPEPTTLPILPCHHSEGHLFPPSRRNGSLRSLIPCLMGPC